MGLTIGWIPLVAAAGANTTWLDCLAGSWFLVRNTRRPVKDHLKYHDNPVPVIDKSKLSMNSKNQNLVDFLADRGYMRVPLTRSGVGHFHTEGTLNGRKVEVLVDTGAASTVVSMRVVQSLGLRSEWLNDQAGGAGGVLDQFRIEGADLRLGDIIPRVTGPVGLDFEHVNSLLRAQGSAEVDVILGADVFDAHAAVIDYPSQTLFLKEILS